MAEGLPNATKPITGELIARFLEARVPEYRTLAELRRKTADQATAATARHFYSMMQNIAQEMNSATQVLQIEKNGSEPPSILDFCVAPGGFLNEVMRLNPYARVRAFSLPVSEGGHRVMMPRNARTSIEFLDVTMLADDMEAGKIPFDHPDAQQFLGRRLQVTWKFDLILCDGQVLRGRKRAAYREQCEAQRLLAVQLALGLLHVKYGGSMVILLHELDAWDTLATVFRFSKFSSIRLFKPQHSHAKRPSFYLIATQIQSDHADAVAAIGIWKGVWTMTTFPGGEDSLIKSVTDGLDVNQVLVDFGQMLIEQRRALWSIQADALAQAPFMR